MSYLCSIKGKEFIGSNYTLKKRHQNKKTVPFVARESEIITEIHIYACGLAYDITREKQIALLRTVK